MEILKGIPVSSGFAIAKAFILDSEESLIPRRFISESEVEQEIKRFHLAVEKAKSELRVLQRKMADEIGGEAAPIFDAHILILSDQSLHDEVLTRIRRNRFTAEYAISRSLRKFEKALRSLDDAYLAQRVADLKDIEHRLLDMLLGERRQELHDIRDKVVLVAHDLTPSQTASINRENVIGFATDVGGLTGHTAIVARAREIPAVVGLGTVSSDVSNGDMLIIDGNRGIVVLNPDVGTLDAYQRMMQDFHVFEEALIGEKDLPAVTLDGCRVNVHANIEFPSEVETVLHFGGEGVGLFRTEFLYLESDTPPGEEEHFRAYRQALRNIGGLPVIIRLVDLGADKFMHAEQVRAAGEEALLHERNPMLGSRAIRFGLKHPDGLRQQIRAIVRASALGTVKLMIPMVTDVQEVTQVRQVVRAVQAELAEEEVPFDPDMQVGIMVEVPSVALTIDKFIDSCDFFSIGTNDLTQYVLAADRTNENVADLYQPAHPAVLRLVKQVIEVARGSNIHVGVCGEVAGDPLFVIFLLGVGLRNFSVSPPLIPEVKKLVRCGVMEKAEEVADIAMGMATARETLAYLRNITREFQPGLSFL